jgi:hypothetical protein
MKEYSEKYHDCRYCNLDENNFRVYIRTRKLESRSLRRYNQEKRGFEAIGWYCKQCRFFETDEMISRRTKESIKDRFDIKSDVEYEKFIRSGSETMISELEQ